MSRSKGNEFYVIYQKYLNQANAIFSNSTLSQFYDRMSFNAFIII